MSLGAMRAQARCASSFFVVLIIERGDGENGKMILISIRDRMLTEQNRPTYDKRFIHR